MRYAPLTLLLLTLCPLAAGAGELDLRSTESRHLEALLAKSLQAVGNNRLDAALNDVDALLKTYPNFKLAQLVKGDLLLARARPLSNFGNAPDAPKERLNDLRDEARARLQRVQQQQPVTRSARYLWQLNPQQNYAIVVDTSKSTLYLFRNVNGEARYVEDFYISVGKKGADKVAEGDQKTPLGVYFIDSYLSKNQLTDFYGSGAYPLNYPNEWDKKQGRNGHGIWLHGTPSDTYSRPPLASNGCVVLANNDLTHLGKSLQVGLTPVIITSRMEWSDDADKAERTALLQAIEQWRNDWSSLNTDAYLSHYASDFSSGSTDRAAWSQQKRLVNSGKSWIKVQLSGMSVFPYPTQPNLVVVNFEQDYASNNLVNRMKKRQYWMKRDNRWQIVYEGSA
jgi:murein L,D-transpeptidase YafK